MFPWARKKVGGFLVNRPDDCPLSGLSREHLRSWVPLAAVLFVATLASTVYNRPPSRTQGGAEPIGIAYTLIETGSFADPFRNIARTGPTAHLPPVYPLLLAFLIKHFGQLSYIVLTVLVHALHASLLPLASVILFGRLAPGVCGAALAIVMPVYELFPTWDAMYTASGLLLFCLVSSVIAVRWGLGVAAGGLTGAGGAFLLLLNPISITVIAPWILYILHAGGVAVRKAIPYVSALGFAAVLGCLPWTLRNYQRLGALVLIRDDLGIALNTSYNDCAEASLEENLANGCHAAHHPLGSTAEAQLVLNLGEVNYNRLRLASALGWIRTHPKRALVLTTRRFVNFWLPPHAWPVRLLTALSLAGCLAMWRRRIAALRFFLMVFAAFPALYYAVESNVRYRYPILWLTLLSAGYLVWLLSVKIRGAVSHAKLSGLGARGRW